MISRYEAYMDGEALSAVDPSLLILDIHHNDPGLQIKKNALGGRDGAVVTGRYLEKASVTISFAIREYNIANRQAVCSRVIKWAKGTVLKTNDRTGQMLYCICDDYPVINSAMAWTDPLSITFSAYGIPYWQEEFAKTATLTDTSENDTLFVPGSADMAFVNVDITAGAAVSSLTVGCGETAIELTGLALSDGDVVSIAYDQNGLMSIKKGNTSLLNKRTAASSDDLIAVCGEENEISITASGSVTAVFSVRGCWI